MAAATGGIYVSYPAASAPWNANAVTAQYVGARLRELDSSTAALFLAYDLQNNTNSDYNFAGSAGSVVMERNSDKSLSPSENIQVSYAAFLPPHDRARIELEIKRPFAWPAEDNSEFQNILKRFVNERLTGLDEVVLFDQVNHYQVIFPRGWEDLGVASGGAR